MRRLPAGAELPPAVVSEAHELNFLLLRQKAAEHLRQHADDFKPFVLQVRPLCGRCHDPPALVPGRKGPHLVTSHVLVTPHTHVFRPRPDPCCPSCNLDPLQEDLAAAGGGDDAFEAYCAEVEGTAAWGGQVELQVGPWRSLHAASCAWLRGACCGCTATCREAAGAAVGAAVQLVVPAGRKALWRTSTRVPVPSFPPSSGARPRAVLPHSRVQRGPACAGAWGGAQG